MKRRWPIGGYGLTNQQIGGKWTSVASAWDTCVTFPVAHETHARLLFQSVAACGCFSDDVTLVVHFSASSGPPCVIGLAKRVFDFIVREKNLKNKKKGEHIACISSCVTKKVAVSVNWQWPSGEGWWSDSCDSIEGLMVFNDTLMDSVERAAYFSVILQFESNLEVVVAVANGFGCDG